MPQPRLLAKPTFTEPRQMTPTLACLDCSYSSFVTILQERNPNQPNLTMIVMIDKRRCRVPSHTRTVTIPAANFFNVSSSARSVN
ncbi:hypothetical protein BO85DRAFT_450216 [Aspergillus piperis CBS 112811]|uniref:Uncharacterized protein n=1 Tax=Aspergillus piperis CBS 112811 TaxID=1448313 RepID=A0A8G1R0A3_9EURO|nr:hypothetical protein BO85DRAFT_450216 [Aspergillus piperis CBS 112811]RAH56822.1 hypothetical protein BO85DRAFT_450216 [Aspergillus piperis CBS 112811]